MRLSFPADEELKFAMLLDPMSAQTRWPSPEAVPDVRMIALLPLLIVLPSCWMSLPVAVVLKVPFPPLAEASPAWSRIAWMPLICRITLLVTFTVEVPPPRWITLTAEPCDEPEFATPAEPITLLLIEPWKVLARFDASSTAIAAPVAKSTVSAEMSNLMLPPSTTIPLAPGAGVAFDWLTRFPVTDTLFDAAVLWNTTSIPVPHQKLTWFFRMRTSAVPSLKVIATLWLRTSTDEPCIVPSVLLANTSESTAGEVPRSLRMRTL